VARTQPSPEDLRKLRELAAQWGKIVARRAVGTDGPGLDIDFTTLEEVALEAARGLTEGALAALLEHQARALGAEQPCPSCGRPCPVGREPRPLHLQGGQQVLHDEPVCSCPACRRDFFPSPAGLAPRRPRLQPPAVLPDP
jgi:hypothetical protein